MLVTPTQDTSSEYAATHRLVNFQQSLIPVYKYKLECFVILLLPKWYKVKDAMLVYPVTSPICCLIKGGSDKLFYLSQ